MLKPINHDSMKKKICSHMFSSETEKQRDQYASQLTYGPDLLRLS